MLSFRVLDGADEELIETPTSSPLPHLMTLTGAHPPLFSFLGRSYQSFFEVFSYLYDTQSVLLAFGERQIVVMFQQKGVRCDIGITAPDFVPE